MPSRSDRARSPATAPWSRRRPSSHARPGSRSRSSRPRFQEPRVHFALVCAARGCPPLRAEAYVGARLEAQLADQVRRVHSDTRWLRFDPASLTLHLTRLYDWYGSDFLQTSAAASVEQYVAAHELS